MDTGEWPSILWKRIEPTTYLPVAIKGTPAGTYSYLSSFLRHGKTMKIKPIFAWYDPANALFPAKILFDPPDLLEVPLRCGFLAPSLLMVDRQNGQAIARSSANEFSMTSSDY
jgi:hypothetical protein